MLILSMAKKRGSEQLARDRASSQGIGKRHRSRHKAGESNRQGNRASLKEEALKAIILEKIKEEVKEEIKEELKKELKEKLREEVKEELKEELKEDVKEELNEEVKEELRRQKKNIRRMSKQLEELKEKAALERPDDAFLARRSEPNHMQPPSFSLKIRSRMKDAVEKGKSIITDDGDSIVVDLYDGDNLIARSHPLASARVMMVVLDGKFNNSRCSWSKEDFEKSIKRPREGNSATGDVNQTIESIVSNCIFNLEGGTRQHSGATIWENSGNSKVKLGVMVLSHPEERVLEGVSEKSFHVRDVPKKLKKQRAFSQSKLRLAVVKNEMVQCLTRNTHHGEL